MNIGKQASDLCSSSISQYFVAAYFESGPWEEYVRSLIEIYRRRRDVMLDALAEHFPREAEWTHPQGGLFIWATLPDYIDTTDLLARALRGARRVRPRPRRVRRRARRLGDAAELLGRRRGRHPRGDPADRRGRARAGRAVRHADRAREPADAAPRARSARDPVRAPSRPPARRARQGPSRAHSAAGCDASGRR